MYRKIFCRKYLLWTVTFIAAALLYHCTSSTRQQEDPQQNSPEDLKAEMMRMPNFCAHEHWGSIDAIGGYQSFYNGFRSDVIAGATPVREVTVWDIIFDPYFSGMLAGAGVDPNQRARDAGYESLRAWWKRDPSAALQGFRKDIFPLMTNSIVQTLFGGVELLYGVNLHSFEPGEWLKADSLIRSAYAEMFSWIPRAMENAHFTELIRPVQPEFYLLEQSTQTKKAEMAFSHTVLRVDPFLDMWGIEDARRDSLARMTGIDPVDAESWRAFIRHFMALAGEQQAVGIKQLQAYRRDLNFKPRKDGEVIFRGDLNAREVKVFQDWVMHAFCREANERGWVHQIHVGTHNLKDSSPLPLDELGRRYPRMKIVMLHCWPFFEETAFLAKNYPNFYIDNCWLPVLSREFFRQALDVYLNYVPAHKIMCSHDATSVEMAAGSSLIVRKILWEKLREQQELPGFSNEMARTLALDLLHNNAARLYGVGRIRK